jgi:hypothetical protein
VYLKTTMIEENKIFFAIILIAMINLFFIGYLVGKSNRYTDSTNRENISFFKKTREEKYKNDISIDNKKVVLDIKTEGLEKKYDSLGDIKKSEENISNSVNKLKKMKN